MTFRGSVLLALACLAGGHAMASEWPERSVRLVLPGLPGGGPDRVTRLIAEQLAKV